MGPVAPAHAISYPDPPKVDCSNSKGFTPAQDAMFAISVELDPRPQYRENSSRVETGPDGKKSGLRAFAAFKICNNREATIVSDEEMIN